MLIRPGVALGAPAPRLFCPPSPQTFGPYTPGIQRGTPIADRWGDVYFPAEDAPVNVSEYPGDPALDYTLGFLYSWLVLDNQANAPFQKAFGIPVIASPKSLFPHNPADYVFSASYLPSLYLWRDDQQGGKFEYLGDEWLEEHSVWTMLWALPQGGQENQEGWSRYANQFVKAVVVGVERGVTPSWVIPGDPDPHAQYQGSFLGYWTNLVRFFLTSWKRTKIKIQMADGSVNQSYPAVEMKFEVRERQERTIRRFPPLNYLDQRIYDRFGLLVGREIDH